MKNKKNMIQFFLVIGLGLLGQSDLERVDVYPVVEIWFVYRV